MKGRQSTPSPHLYIFCKVRALVKIHRRHCMPDLDYTEEVTTNYFKPTV
jgi:hypothetical protein